VDPRIGLDAVAKRKKFHYCPCREKSPGPTARGLVSTLTELPDSSRIIDHIIFGVLQIRPHTVTIRVESQVPKRRISYIHSTQRTSKVNVE